MKVKPVWALKLEELVKIDERYKEGMKLIEGIYPHNLLWICQQYTSANLRYLSSRELHLYFLEEVLLRGCSIEQLREYCDYFRKSPHGTYGVDEAVMVMNLRVGDRVRHCGSVWTVSSIAPVIIGKNNNQEDITNLKIVYRLL